VLPDITPLPGAWHRCVTSFQGQKIGLLAAAIHADFLP